MPFIDSHCHLHDSRIIPDLSVIIDRAVNAGVKTMVTCATMEENFELTRNLAMDHPSVAPCFGIHPWFIDSVSAEWEKKLENYLMAIPSGVGEIGLDFVDKEADQARQIKVFEYQFALAREMGRPVNIHIRKAWDTLIHILKRVGKLETPGLIHSYSGSADMVPVFEKYGLYISFSGSVTHPGAKKGIQALKRVSPDRFVIETDSPDILPFFSGIKLTGRNEPANLAGIAEIAARRSDADPDEFICRAHTNSLRLFESIIKKERNDGSPFR